MDDDLNWVDYPDNKPTEDGYYYTLYFNPQLNELLYKSLWYSTEQKMFQGHWHWAWHYGEDIIATDGRKFKPIIYHPLDVQKYVPESRTDFYGQQFRKIDELLK